MHTTVQSKSVGLDTTQRKYRCLKANSQIQPGAVKLVLWRHWMHVTQVHPVMSENQFHCTRLYSVFFFFGRGAGVTGAYGVLGGQGFGGDLQGWMGSWGGGGESIRKAHFGVQQLGPVVVMVPYEQHSVASGLPLWGHLLWPDSEHGSAGTGHVWNRQEREKWDVTESGRFGHINFMLCVSRSFPSSFPILLIQWF